MCVYTGRVHADGGGATAAPRASDRRTTAGRQVSRHDVIHLADVIDRDVTTPAAARRRQAG